MLRRAPLMQLYRRLLGAYGAQHWWPADGPFEVMVGAVLTQNTSWKNVEQAIGELKRADVLNAEAIARLDRRRLARLIRPSGYFNVKAKRLQNLCRWIADNGGERPLRRRGTARLRRELLAVNGVGPETADDILLYAFNRPVFVIDAYTRRLFSRMELIDGGEPYEALRTGVESALEPDASLFNEFHALIVRHAKEPCAATGACRHCGVER